MGPRDKSGFRLGTTSYILADGIIPNLRYLRGQVDDVEIVLFESDDFTNLPSPEEVSTMAELAAEADLTFTVHLPLDTRLGSADESERAASVRKCRSVMDRMEPLDSLAYVLHLHGDRRGDPPSTDLGRWEDRNRRSVTEILEGPVPPHRICVENLDYDFSLAAGLVESMDLSVCIDIGHLLVTGMEVGAHLERWGGRTRVVHLHGVRDGYRDHSDIGHLPPGLLKDLLAWLEAGDPPFERVLTLEVFGENDFSRSMAVLRELPASLRKKGCQP